jgi:methyltransferase (TIGR00027 family)
MRRASHQLLDHPRVLDDPLALRIIGPEAADRLARDREWNEHSASRPMRAFFAVRSRLAEDELARAIARGVSQYVILGAGLDTYAYRHRSPDLKVFEVDHPTTQAWKREQLDAAGIAIPESVTFVPVDLEAEILADRLGGSGLDVTRPAFFAWLGVVPYLTADAVRSTLTFIASCPSGTSVAFDYVIASDLLTPAQRAVCHALARRVEAVGEPWRTSFDPSELQRELLSMGFSRATDVDAEAINARYFNNRADGLRVGALARVMVADV